jgi:hypothetical protein
MYFAVTDIDVAFLDRLPSCPEGAVYGADTIVFQRPFLNGRVPTAELIAARRLEIAAAIAQIRRNS